MNTIDTLWEKQAQDLTNDDVDQIIAYIRGRVAAYESGVKPKREQEENLDLGAVVAKISQAHTGKPTAPMSKIKRRF